MNSAERKLERLSRLLERLRDETSAGALLLVEGERDIVSLRAIGIESNIVAIKSGGRSLQELIDMISSLGREVIVLTDFDRRGRELAERLRKSLEGAKTRVNLAFWRELCELLGGEIKDIEGLAACLENLRRKVEKGKEYM